MRLCMNKTLNVRSLLSPAVLLAGMAIVFFLSYNSIWVGDDADYSFVLADDFLPMISVYSDDAMPRLIGSFPDVVDSQLVHWCRVNGRSVAHVLVQIFCAGGSHSLFAVCNSLVFAAFVLLLFRVSRIPVSYRRLLLAEGLYFLFFYYEYTPSCQICYLWMFTLVLAWCVAFRAARGASFLMILPAFLFGVVAGNGNEALNVGFSMALFLWWLHHRGDMNACRWSQLAGFATGCALLVLSPGNFARMGTAFSEPVNLVARVLFCVPLAIPLIMAVRRKIRGAGFKSLYAGNAIWWNTLFCSVLFVSCVGVLSNRVFFGAYLAVLILIMRMWRDKPVSVLWISAIWLLNAFFYVDGMHYSYLQRVRYNEIHSRYMDSGDGIVEVPTPVDKPVRPYGASCSRYVPALESDQYFNSLKRLWAARKPGGPLLRLLPEGLPQLTDSVEDAYTIGTGDDYWWAVRPKGSDVHFMCHYSVGVGPYRKHYADVPLSFSNPEVVASQWEAKLMTSDSYLGVLKTDSITVAPVQKR